MVDPDFAASYISGVTKESLVVAVLCETTLKLIAYNYNPTIKIDIQNEYAMEVSEQTIYV